MMVEVSQNGVFLRYGNEIGNDLTLSPAGERLRGLSAARHSLEVPAWCSVCERKPKAMERADIRGGEARLTRSRRWTKGIWRPGRGPTALITMLPPSIVLSGVCLLEIISGPFGDICGQLPLMTFTGRNDSSRPDREEV
jgi:hypothetical protein